MLTNTFTFGGTLVKEICREIIDHVSKKADLNLHSEFSFFYLQKHFRKTQQNASPFLESLRKGLKEKTVLPLYL